MNMVASIGLIVAGIIHVLPVTGVLGPEHLSRLYGVHLEDRSIILLMQHRAVLFALLGALLVAAAFVPGLRPAALVAGLVSIVAFLVLAGAPSSNSSSIIRVIIADWIALVALLPALAVTIQQGFGGDG